MSLRAPLVYVLPDETARVAQAAFPNGNPYVLMRDTLGPIFTNPDFAALFPRAVSRPKPQPASPSSPSCSSPKTSPIARPPMRCAPDWTGNTCSRLSWMTQVSMRRC